jgi:hypothetical protein
MFRAVSRGCDPYRRHSRRRKSAEEADLAAPALVLWAELGVGTLLALELGVVGDTRETRRGWRSPWRACELNTAVCGAVAALGLVGLALASGAPKFSTLDRNRDGYISHDEARNAPEVVRTFADVDVDKNGKLDPGEYARLLKRLAS